MEELSLPDECWWAVYNEYVLRKDLKGKRWMFVALERKG